MRRGVFISSGQILSFLCPIPSVGEHQMGYLEEGHAGASVDRAVLNGGLVSEVVHRLNGHIHALHRQEGRQVGRVGRDDDQCERPPTGKDQDVIVTMGAPRSPRPMPRPAATQGRPSVPPRKQLSA